VRRACQQLRLLDLRHGEALDSLTDFVDSLQLCLPLPKPVCGYTDSMVVRSLAIVVVVHVWVLVCRVCAGATGEWAVGHGFIVGKQGKINPCLEMLWWC
jgi:hypothetical protein